jgi:hypothetical protein
MRDTMFRKLLLIVSGLTLALGVFTAPTAAVDPTAKVIFVNAIPGVKVDLCSGGEERVSGLKYGRAAYENPPADELLWFQIRVAKPGKCKGKKLYGGSVTWVDGGNYTQVFWKPGAKVKVRTFENDVSLPAPDGDSMVIRHTAKAAATDFWVWQSVVGTSDTGPTVPGLKRSQQSRLFAVSSRPTIIQAYPVKRTKAWRYKSAFRNLQPGKAYQAILMGTRQKNMKLKVFGQPGVFVP